jgi:hypothetical protein
MVPLPLLTRFESIRKCPQYAT